MPRKPLPRDFKDHHGVVNDEEYENALNDYYRAMDDYVDDAIANDLRHLHDFESNPFDEEED